MKQAVFFDRDGVLNQVRVLDGTAYPPANRGEFEIAPDAEAALRRLKDAGFLLIVVTNQPDVRRGIITQSEVEAMHDLLRQALPLDDFFICYHDDRDRCECRKPQPGMLLAAAARYSIDLSRSFLVGDRWRDVDAGAQAGCATILIDRGYRERAPRHAPDARVQSLDEAAHWILAKAPQH